MVDGKAMRLLSNVAAEESLSRDEFEFGSFGQHEFHINFDRVLSHLSVSSRPSYTDRPSFRDWQT